MCSAALFGFWTNFGLHIFVWVSSVFSFKIYFTCTRGVEELLIPSSLLLQMDKTRIHSYTAFPFVWAVLIKKSWITFYNMLTYVIQHIIHPGPGCLQVPEGIFSQLGLEFHTKATSSSLTNNMLYISTTQYICYIYLQHSLTLAEAPLCPQDLRFSSIQGINYNWF